VNDGWRERNRSSTPPRGFPAAAVLLGAPLLAAVLTAGCEREKLSPAKPAGSIDAKVIRIVSEQFGVKSSEISRTSRLKEDLKADELDQVELVMELEDEFQISIADEDAEDLRSVGQIIDYVRSQPKTPAKSR
jgi:acyl carrier protein